jgi:hypothetical protein
MFKCCFSGTVWYIWEVYFLIVKPHTQLTTSFISIVSYNNNTFMGDQQFSQNYFLFLKFLEIKPLNLVMIKLFCSIHF